MVATPVWWWLACAGLVLTVVGWLVMRPSAKVLATTPFGIVPFELARTVDRSRTILTGWGSAGQRAARHNLVADFPFLAGYTLLLVGLTGAGSGSAAEGTWPVVAGVGLVIVVTAAVAGLCDLLENLMLLRILVRARGSDPPSAAVVGAAWRFALVKFTLLAVVAAWLMLFVLPAVLAR